MVVALHHLQGKWHFTEAPQGLLAYLDGQLPCVTVRCEDVLSEQSRGVQRKINTKKASSANVILRAERMIPDGESPPSKKRRIAGVTARCRSKSAAVDSTKWLTLARVDIDLTFSGSPGAFADPTARRNDEEPYVIKFLRFICIANNTYQCTLATEDGHILFDGSVGSQCDRKALDILQHAAELSHTRKNLARSKTSISRSSTKNNERGVRALDGADRQSSIEICVRILVPDAGPETYLSTPAWNKLFDACMPTTLSVRKEPWSPRDFYDNVHVPSRDMAVSPTTSYNGMNCTLLPFQCRAVDWLLDREQHAAHHKMGSCHRYLPRTRVQVVDGDGTPCFVDRFLGVITTCDDFVAQDESYIHGGILAEEMGLGKTVELIALMLKHRQPQPLTHCESSQGLPCCPATLIITPPAILEQWKVELENLAPTMKVYIYQGLRAEAGKGDHEALLRRCLQHDVVLTTFNILAKEIHYADSRERDLRHRKRYEKRLSPLTQIFWWRVVLDEAQMVESGVSNAAKVANMIPRRNAWCVTGTPVKRDYNDLFGLLLFLRCQPYSNLPKLWGRLVTEHKHVFKHLIRSLALRHTKEQIRDEIHLPAQKRIVITVPFTQIEEQHYSTMFQEMAEDCGLSSDGAPLREDWDPESQVVIDKMRIWLQRLRQTCLHPEVGTRNRRALGGRGPLRTVNEVLAVMMEQNHTAAFSEESTLLRSQLRRGQILEHAGRTQEALEIWLGALSEVEMIVRECRKHLENEYQRMQEVKGIESEVTDHDSDDVASHLGPHRMRLRAALEMEHMCVFFTANAYYQLKEKEDSQTEVGAAIERPKTNGESVIVPYQSKKDSEEPQATQPPARPKSDRFRQLEELETAAYDRAKGVRKELLSEARKRADVLMTKINKKSTTFVDIPKIDAIIGGHGGIESRKLIEKLEALLDAFRSQTEKLKEWRTKTVQLLTVPLVDEKETEISPDSEEVGKEYEDSTKHQDELYVYVDALRALVSDRRDVITGQQNQLIEHEMKVALRQAREGEGPAPPLFRDLMSLRQKIRPSKDQGSIRGLQTELRELKTDLRGAVERNNSRAAAEMIIVNMTLQKLQQISTEQSKAADALDREVELLKDTMNSRLEFYRQLQAISDSVAPYEDPMSDEVRANVLINKETHEEYLRTKIGALKSKGRYLLHLHDQATKNEGARVCIICTDPIETGVLTSCGHTFCLECLRLWWGSHQTCPTCKKHLRKQDFHQITYKPAELTMEEEAEQHESTISMPEIAEHASIPNIYSGIREPVLHQIQNIDLEGSFGTKIDTMARHLLWIREHDPGAKSIIFSQYKDFLHVLGRALKKFKIGFTSIDAKDGIHKFKEDHGIECFFLHAKAHSSGLNLVNATHVFLCEPLINTAIELQAIARVHRIGQQNETTVWMYLVEGTVERSIYEISVQRRLAHMGRLKERNKAPAKIDNTALENSIEAANSLELEDTPLSNLLTKGSGGGEMVPKEDLWNCLFSQKPAQGKRVFVEAQREVTRHLGAEAAEARIQEANDLGTV